jgi:hypothetical protein
VARAVVVFTVRVVPPVTAGPSISSTSTIKSPIRVEIYLILSILSISVNNVSTDEKPRESPNPTFWGLPRDGRERIGDSAALEVWKPKCPGLPPRDVESHRLRSPGGPSSTTDSWARRSTRGR